MACFSALPVMCALIDATNSSTAPVSCTGQVHSEVRMASTTVDSAAMLPIRSVHRTCVP
jgi:hypothetical protein